MQCIYPKSYQYKSKDNDLVRKRLYVILFYTFCESGILCSDLFASIGSWWAGGASLPRAESLAGTGRGWRSPASTSSSTPPAGWSTARPTQASCNSSRGLLVKTLPPTGRTNRQHCSCWPAVQCVAVKAP